MFRLEIGSRFGRSDHSDTELLRQTAVLSRSTTSMRGIGALGFRVARSEHRAGIFCQTAMLFQSMPSMWGVCARGFRFGR